MKTFLPTTLTALDSIIQADPSVDALERRIYGRALRTPPDRLALLLKAGAVNEADALRATAGPRLIRRAEAARRLGCSLRSVDKWARDGMLRKVGLPGRTRKAGFRESDVVALIEARPAEGGAA